MVLDTTLKLVAKLTLVGVLLAGNAHAANTATQGAETGLEALQAIKGMSEVTPNALASVLGLQTSEVKLFVPAVAAFKAGKLKAALVDSQIETNAENMSIMDVLKALRTANNVTNRAAGAKGDQLAVSLDSSAKLAGERTSSGPLDASPAAINAALKPAVTPEGKAWVAARVQNGKIISEGAKSELAVLGALKLASAKTCSTLNAKDECLMKADIHNERWVNVNSKTALNRDFAFALADGFPKEASKVDMLKVFTNGGGVLASFEAIEAKAPVKTCYVYGTVSN